MCGRIVSSENFGPAMHWPRGSFASDGSPSETKGEAGFAVVRKGLQEGEEGDHGYKVIFAARWERGRISGTLGELATLAFFFPI